MFICAITGWGQGPPVPPHSRMEQTLPSGAGKAGQLLSGPAPKMALEPPGGWGAAGMSSHPARRRVVSCCLAVAGGRRSSRKARHTGMGHAPPPATWPRLTLKGPGFRASPSHQGALAIEGSPGNSTCRRKAAERRAEPPAHMLQQVRPGPLTRIPTSPGQKRPCSACDRLAGGAGEQVHKTHEHQF